MNKRTEITTFQNHLSKNYYNPPLSCPLFIHFICFQCHLLQGTCLRGTETLLFAGDDPGWKAPLSSAALAIGESVNQCSVSFPSSAVSVGTPHSLAPLILAPPPTFSLYSLHLWALLIILTRKHQIILQSWQIPVYDTNRKKPPQPCLVIAFTASKNFTP